MSTAVAELARQISGNDPTALIRATQGVDLTNFLLDSVRLKKLDVDVEGGIQSGYVERTMDGASTVQVVIRDHDRVLLHSGLFGDGTEVTFPAVDVMLDGLGFRLAQITKSGDDITLIFEDRIVAWLRTHNDPRKMSRAKVTRAQFVQILIREVKAGTIKLNTLGELGKAQTKAKVKEPKSAASDKKPTHDLHVGFAPGTKLAGAYGLARLTRTDLDHAAIVMKRANDKGASLRPTIALIEACLVEAPNFANDPVQHDHTSTGILQLLSSTASGLGIDPLNIEQCVDGFLDHGFYGKGGAISLAADNPGWSPGMIAQAVQGSAFPARYDTVHDQAVAIVEAYNGITIEASTVHPSSGTHQTIQPYEFHRGPPDGPKGENSWDCIGRLAAEVRWRRFVVGDTLYFVKDDDLMKRQPIATISEGTDGIEFIDFDIDSNKTVDEATVVCRADRWFAPPGSVVVVENSGPANGRWLTWLTHRNLFTTDCDITLRRPESAKKEPAPESLTVSNKKSKNTSAGGEKLGKVTLAPGTNKRPDGRTVDIHEWVIDFLKLVAGRTSEKILVTTGSNHKQFSSTGGQSDHWTGDAADVNVGGDAHQDAAAGAKGDNIATACLVVLGIDYRTARQWATTDETLNFNGIASNHDWRGYRVQIGWRTMVGGNHYNHVHVGVHRL